MGENPLSLIELLRYIETLLSDFTCHLKDRRESRQIDIMILPQSVNIIPWCTWIVGTYVDHTPTHPSPHPPPPHTHTHILCILYLDTTQTTTCVWSWNTLHKMFTHVYQWFLITGVWNPPSSHKHPQSVWQGLLPSCTNPAWVWHKRISQCISNGKFWRLLQSLYVYNWADRS